MAIGNSLPLIGGRSPGFRTVYGSWLAPGLRLAAYVGPPGILEDGYSDNLRVATLGDALNRVRPGKGDVIIALPGFSATVDVADYLSGLVSGVRVVGLGQPTAADSPRLNFTSAAASLWLDQPNVVFQNMTLNFAGVADCTEPVVVSAPGVGFESCRFIMQNDGLSWSARSGITVSTGAHWFRVTDCDFESDSEDDDANVVGGCINVGAPVNGVSIAGNRFTFACPGDTVGIVDVTAAARKLDISNNLFYQLASDGAYCIIIDNVPANGFVVGNKMRISENVAPLLGGLSVGISSRILNADNVVSADSLGSATLVDAVDV